MRISPLYVGLIGAFILQVQAATASKHLEIDGSRVVSQVCRMKISTGISSSLQSWVRHAGNTFTHHVFFVHVSLPSSPNCRMTPIQQSHAFCTRLMTCTHGGELMRPNHSARQTRCCFPAGSWTYFGRVGVVAHLASSLTGLL